MMRYRFCQEAKVYPNKDRGFCPKDKSLANEKIEAFAWRIKFYPMKR